MELAVDNNIKDISAKSALEGANKLIDLIKSLIEEKQYETIGVLFTTQTADVQANLKYLPVIADDLVKDVCLKYLNEDTYEKNQNLYSCASELLKVVACEAPSNLLLMDLLELLEEQKSENVYASTLRAMQGLLLKFGDSNYKALDWSLNTVACSLTEQELPKCLKADFDPRQQNLLEQDTSVDRLLSRYVIVGLFYEPLIKDVLDNSQLSQNQDVFRDCSRKNRRNLLCCFFIRLLGKPLALLDLTDATTTEKNTNSYSLQVSKSLTQGVVQLISDPYFFLTLMECRSRWARPLDPKRNVYELTSKNIFTIEEFCPMVGLSTFYYLVFLEKIILLDNAPKVYAPLFIFESFAYLATELLSQSEPSLQLRGLSLLKYALNQLGNRRVPHSSLDLELHQNLCVAICDIMGFSKVKSIRGFASRLMNKYVSHFDDEGRYLIIMNMLRISPHISFSGYLLTLYKNLVDEALKDPLNSDCLPPQYCGEKFREIMLKHACNLPAGAKTDILDNMEKISSVLSVLYFFVQRDQNNRTGFWNLIGEIERDFLKPLREGLDLSVAHYKAELHRTEHFLDTEDIARDRENCKNLMILNKDEDPNSSIKIDREQKIMVIKTKLCNFDLMYDRLGLLTDKLENARKLFKNLT